MFGLHLKVYNENTKFPNDQIDLKILPWDWHRTKESSVNKQSFLKTYGRVC